MNIFLTNVGTVITSLITWLRNMATALINNEIFQIMLAVVLFVLIYNLLIKIKNEINAKKLAINLTGNKDELNYYRSLSEEEKILFNKKHNTED